MRFPADIIASTVASRLHGIFEPSPYPLQASTDFVHKIHEEGKQL